LGKSLQEKGRGTASYYWVKCDPGEKIERPQNTSPLRAPLSKEDRIQAAGYISNSAGEWAAVPLLIDCGAEVNTIDEKFALQQGLREIKGATLPNIQMPDSTRTFCFHAY
jgi:hypothetical protein